jgi:multidrug efflux pump subunit AcrB
MESIVRFSLKQKIFYNLIFVLLTVLGFLALSNMPAERYPNINLGEVVITTHFPGASPIEVETLVTRKLEETLESVANIDWTTATSFPERSHIRLKFIDDTDYQFLYNEVRFKVLNSMAELPEAADPPVIDSMTVDDWLPVLVINLGGQHNNRALSLMADEVKTSLQKISGVKEVKLAGEFIREFHVYLDPDKLRLLGISFEEVATALQNVNISVPAGDFSTHAGKYLIRVDEKFHSRDQVVQTIIRRDGDGGFTRLEELITRVEQSYREPLVISSVNGKDVVAIQVIKTPSGNALTIKADILAVLDKFQPLFNREKLEVTLTQDSTIKINDGLTTLSLNMLVGMILVSLITWYFMGFRNAALVTIGIPFSFMVTMLIMYLTGNSLNELTLFAFVLVTGIIVDDAIVVSENIYRHVQQGEELYDAIVTGVAEVALPVISSTLTTIAAFLPMLIMSGSTGEFFAQIPTAVTYALAASLLECLLILPIHYLDFGPRPSPTLSARLDQDNFILSWARTITCRVLNFTLNFRLFSVLIVFLLLFISIAILYVSATGKLALVKIKFFPDDYALYYVDIKGPPETPIEKIDAKVKDISAFIMSGEPGTAIAAAGFAGFYPNEDYEPVYSNNFGTVMVMLPGKEQQSFADPIQYLQQVRSKLKQTFAQDGFTLDVHAQKDGPPTGKDINVRILGSNFSSITELADNLYQYMHNDAEFAPYLLGLTDDRGQAKRIYRFNVRHERVQEYNLNSSQVARLAGSVLDGRYIGKFRLSDKEIDLKLYIDPEIINSPQQALTIPFIEHPTGPINLGDVTRLQTYKERGELHRYQGQRAVSLKANLQPEAPTSTAAVLNAISQFYEEISHKYPGATVIFGGEHDDTQRSYQSLGYAFLIGVMIMYIILATQFQSYLQPAIILSAIVFALIGVVFGKLLTQSLFTVNSFIAVIGVAGVVVNDSLMLIDFMNKGYRAGLTRREAIDEGIRVRLRPILLTTLTTTLGLLPMALGIPEYSMVWGSMASTFVTGLSTATTLTLFIVPVLWDFVQARQEKQLSLIEKSKGG